MEEQSGDPIEQAVRDSIAAVLADGRAHLQVETFAEGTPDEARDLEITPTNPASARFAVEPQSPYEVWISVGVPGQPDRAPVLEISTKDEAELARRVGAYAQAITAGRITLTLRPGSSKGRIRVRLSDGDARSHLYNCLSLVGRGDDWETFRPAPY